MACCDDCAKGKPCASKSAALSEAFAGILEKSPHHYHKRGVAFGADPTHQNDSWVSDEELLEYGAWLNEKIQLFNRIARTWDSDPPNSTGTRTLILRQRWYEESPVVCGSINHCPWELFFERWEAYYPDFKDSYYTRIGSFKLLNSFYDDLRSYTDSAKKIGLPGVDGKDYVKPPPDKGVLDTLSEAKQEWDDKMLVLGVALVLGYVYYSKRAR